MGQQSDVMLRYFADLAAGVEARLAADPGPGRARKVFALEVARLGVRLFSGRGPIAWCGVLAPFDLLGALGVTSCFVEFVGAQLAVTGRVEGFLEAAEQAGWPMDGCAYHRSVFGAALRGLIPAPSFLIGTSSPCAGGLSVIETLARMHGRDLFVLDFPHVASPDGRAEATAIATLADRMRAMARFVEERTGTRLDPERLREVVRLGNEASESLRRAFAAARRVPSPARRQDLANVGIVMPLLLGTEAGVRVARAFEEELTRKAEAGEAGVPGEAVRLLWIQNRIQFPNPLLQDLERDHRVAIVTEEFNDVFWSPIDPDDPFPGMAARALSPSLTGSVRRRVERLVHLAREARVHGAVNPCHWGCRQGTGARGLVERGLREAGIPVLNLEVDCVDPRPFAAGQLRTRLAAFAEMLAARGPVQPEASP